MILSKNNIFFKIITLLLFVFLTQGLYATWSIVAVDPVSGDVGSAGASYTPAVWPILGIDGGHGVVVAQAFSNESGRVTALKMIREGKSPDEIIEVITNPQFDSLFTHQQYGIATLNADSGAYTGADCEAWAGHEGNEWVSVQANIMASDHVVSDAFAAYLAAEAEGLPLADRLMAALLAGSEAGGDSRADNETAMTAYIAVAKPGDAPGKPSFAIIMPPQGKGINPVKVLSERFEELKGTDHPVFFPSLKMLLILFFLLPIIVGTVSIVVISVKNKPRKFGLRTLRDLGISVLTAAASFFIVAGLCILLSCAAPIYGVYTLMVPVIISLADLLVFIIIRTIFMVVKKIRK